MTDMASCSVERGRHGRLRSVAERAVAPGGAYLLAALAGFGLLLAPAAAQAQARGVVERNLPPAVTTPGGGLSLDGAPAGVADTAPLGIDLTGIRLIGLKAAVLPHPPAGVTLVGVEGVPEASLRNVLVSFLGKPMSHRLIADVQAAIARVYREAGPPFVSVTAPPQEITDGVLQLHIVAFRMGKVAVKGDAADAGLAASLRVSQGELIEAPRLAEDLDWLNRFPYRQLNGVFEPGSNLGASDLTLEVTRKKPWQAFAGWSNTGTQETGYNRFFAGFGAGIEALNDLTLSYQITGSGNLYTNPSSIALSGEDWPSYVSHAGRIVLPTFDRQAIEIAPSFVATSQDSIDGILTFQNTTFELPILYRSAVSNFDARLAGWGDIYGGVSPKWLERKIWYQGVEVADGSAGVFDLILGWSNFWQRAGSGSTALDLRLVGNPGDVVSGNDDASWTLFSNGRVTSADYAYFYGSLNQVTPLAALPGLAGYFWTASLIAQVAGDALPDTEQLAIGGYYSTRGYTLDDGSVDAGFVLRNELRAPSVPLLGRLGLKDLPAIGAAQDTLSPFAFVDVSYGHNYNLDALVGLDEKADTTLVGLGAGFDYTLAANLQVGGVVGVALTDGPETDRGTVTGQMRIIASF